MTTLTQISLSQIGQIAVNVHDLERATAFYRYILGMKHLFSATKMSLFDCDGIRLMLSLPESPKYDHPSSIIYFKVPDIKAAYEGLLSLDVVFDSKPALIVSTAAHDVWTAFFRDTENNVLAITSDVSKDNEL